MNEEESKVRKALEQLQFDEKIRHGEMTQKDRDIEMAQRMTNMRNTRKIQ